MAAYNTEGLIGGRLKIGNTLYELTEIRYGANGALVWPTAYIATLTPTWSYGGQYTLAAIPASGGTATVTQWLLTITRVADGVQVYSGAVTPSVTISDTTNFSYASNIWTANNRGRNGINTASGTTVPTSQPARTCDLSATYSTTYNNVPVTASYQVTMTQNKNDAHAGAVSYSNLRFTLSKYNASNSAAPAYQTTDATVDAKADRSTAYSFDSGASYSYNEADAVGSNGFSFSAASNWVSFSGTGVTVAGRDHDNGNARSQTLTATLTADNTKTKTVTIYQADNKRYEKSRTLSSYSISLSSSSIGAGQNTIYVYGTASYNVVYGWPSQAADTTGTASESQNPTGISTSPDVGSGNISVANHSVTIPANETGSDREFTIYGSYGGKSGSASLSQQAIVYTYDTPVVSLAYDTIGAAGGTIYPTISFTQKIRQNGTHVGTISGTLTGGATSGNATNSMGGTVHFELTTISGSSVNGSFSTSNAGVTIGSRGTTVGDARVAARYIYVKLKCNNVTGDSYDNIGFVTCNQAANAKTDIAAVYSSVAIQSLSKSSVDTCAATNITATVKATWTEAGAKYSAYDDGDTTAYTGLTQHTNETVTGTNGVTIKVNNLDTYQNSTNQFSVNNLHNTSQKSHSVVAMFGGLTSSAKTVTQAADSQSDWLMRDYTASISIASNNVTAAGGSFTVSASGSHVKYKKWNSDNTEVSGSASTVSDTPSLSLIDISSSGVFTLSGSTVSHRDMTNNATTDSVKVRATNGSATADTAAVSVTNFKSYGTISMSSDSAYVPAGGGAIRITVSCPITWTSGYSEDSLTAADFTFSFYTKGNDGKRTYTIEGTDTQNRKVLTFGSLGTNEISSAKDTVIRASHSAAGTKDHTLTERANTVESSELIVNWNITGMPISGVGGTATVGITSASLSRTFSSGAQNSTSLSAPTVLAATTVSAKKSSGQIVKEQFAFIRSSSVPSAPTGGTYASPVPSGWSDGVPSGSAALWMSRRVFTSNGQSPQQSTWSTPVQIINSSALTYKFSEVKHNPGNPTSKAANWHDTPTTSDILMAFKKTGATVWEMINIKGENATGFDYTYTSGSSSLKVNAIVNRGDEELISRFCNLTTNYSGKTSNISVEQNHVFYATKVITDSGVIKAYIKNMDPNSSHSFTYVVTRNGSSDSPVTSSFAYSEGWRQVGGLVAQAGNTLTVEVTAQDGSSVITS